MIAAVVDPRGTGAAQATLARIAASWGETRAGVGVVVARSADATTSDRIEAPIELRDAAAVLGSDAFVALDARANDRPSVILGRGSLGGRALFYTRSGPEGAWAACSHLEPLLRARTTPSTPDADRLASLVAGLRDPRPRATVFEDVARVEPCTAVRLCGDAAEVEARPSVERAPLEGTAPELGDELWRRFEGAVGRAIGTAKNVAVMVGGGVDSSGLLAATVALARGATTREVAALALDFDAISTDRPYLADLSRALGIVPVRLAPRDAGPYYASSLVLDAQPYILTIGPMEQLVFRRARELGAELLLSGYLADELLAGDLRALAGEALGGAPVRALRRAARVRLPWPTTARERVEHYVLRPIVKPLVPRRLLARMGARQRAREVPWARPRMARVLAELHAHASATPAPRSPRERFDQFARSSVLADYADWRAQLEATTGLVRRDPYADEDVLDLLARVRPSMLCHDDWHRGLFRVALRGRVPESIRLRADKSWFEPAFAEVAEAAGGLASLDELWDMRALEALDIVDGPRLRRALAPLFRDPASTPESAELWSVATQALACEAFLRGQPRGALP